MKPRSNNKSGRVPPQALDVEKTLVGSLLLDPTKLGVVKQFVTHDDLYDARNAVIFRAIEHLVREGQPCDLVTVSDRISQEGKLEAVGGAHYLSELTSLVATTANVERYAAIVAEKSMLRRTIEVCDTVMGEAFDPTADAWSVLEKAERLVLNLRSGTSNSLITAGVAVKRTQALVEKWKQGFSPDYLQTGWPALDDEFGGLPIGEVTVLAGMTSGYKTAALVDLLKRLGLRFTKTKDPQAVILYNAEMTAEKLMVRAAANLSGVSASLIRPDRRGIIRATANQIQAFEKALDKLSSLHLFINDDPAPTHAQMMAEVRQIQTRMPVALVAVDYLEKVHVPGHRDTEELRVSRIIQDFKKLAKITGTAGLILSQYSRGAEAKPSWPANYWLRYSGKIEQEAAMILHLYYPRYFVERGHKPNNVPDYDESNRDRLYISCTKNRDGVTGILPFRIKEETGAFVDPQDSLVAQPGLPGIAPF